MLRTEGNLHICSVLEAIALRHFWSIRGYFEFEQMFGRRPFTDIGLNEAQLQLAEQLLQEEMQNVTIHFGEGRMNPSTIACVLARVEERLTGKLPKLSDLEWGYDYALKAMGLRKNTLEDCNNDTG